VRSSYAARYWRFSAGGISCRSLSGGLAHAWPGGSRMAVPDGERWTEAHRHCGARVGWPVRLLADRPELGIVSGTVAFSQVVLSLRVNPLYQHLLLKKTLSF